MAGRQQINLTADLGVKHPRQNTCEREWLGREADGQPFLILYHIHAHRLTGCGWKAAALTSSSAEGRTHTRDMSETRYTSRMVCTGMMLLVPSGTRLRNSDMWRLRFAQQR